MRIPSFRSLLLATVLPLGLAACGPEVDENILRACDAQAPRGSDAHLQCVSHYESGDVQAQLVIRDPPDPNGIQEGEVQQKLVIRDPDPNGVVIRDPNPNGVIIRGVVIRD